MLDSNDNEREGSIGIRPVVILRSIINISKGEGENSQENPWVLE